MYFPLSIYYEQMKYLNYRKILIICNLNKKICNYCNTDKNVKLLIQNKLNIFLKTKEFIYNNFSLKNALIDAILYDNADVVDLLIDQYKINPSDNKNYALKFAINLNSFKVKNLLLNDIRVYSTLNEIL